MSVSSSPSLRPARIYFFATGWLLVLASLCLAAPSERANKRRAPAGGQRAVVIDERLAVLRDAPTLTANVVRRLSRGQLVAVRGSRRNVAGGAYFYEVVVTSRTRGWLQQESVVIPARAGEDERLLRLVRGSKDFDRLARARIFLDAFPRSASRPAVLLLFGDAAAEAAAKLSREAARRLDEQEMAAGGAPRESYFLSYSGLDRFRKQGAAFTFDTATKQYRYDGAAWREILRRHPRAPESAEAQRRFTASAAGDTL